LHGFFVFQMTGRDLFSHPGEHYADCLHNRGLAFALNQRKQLCVPQQIIDGRKQAV